MTIVNAMALTAANTAFEAKGQEIFGGSRESIYRKFAEVRPIKGKMFTLTGIGAAGKVEKITGTRQYESLRAYANTVPVDRWGPAAHLVSMLELNGDLTGDVERALLAYLSQHESFFEDPILDFLSSNPKGIDGVALFHNSHPFGADGGTWDNLVTDALDATVFAAGCAAMRSFKYENGKNAGSRPTALMVGESNRVLARQLCENRWVAATGGSTVENTVPQGEIEVIYNPEFTTEWVLMDLSPGKGRPIVVGQAQAPVAVAATSPESAAMIADGNAVYYVEAHAALAGGNPYAVYGKIAA